MSVPARDPATAGLEPGSREEALARAAAAWAGQLARTLKTCRLYDAQNPTVKKFRADLAAGLAELLAAHGPLALTFTADDVLCASASLYPARSREDNLGLPFYRDGIRSLTFQPGIEPPEVDAFLDAVLRVTARAHACDEDLVTLLWDAELAHLDLSYASTEADVDGGEGARGADAASPMPWPRAQAAPGADGGAGGAGPAAGEALGDAAGTRSEDWATHDPEGPAQADFDALAAGAEAECARFQSEHAAEAEAPRLAAALALVGDCLACAGTDDDRRELARFAARLLREALTLGAWSDADAALALIERAACADDPRAGLLAELAQPGSLVTLGVIASLDQGGLRAVQEFVALTRRLGPHAVEWLMQIVAESQQQRTRRPLAKAVAALLEGEPERLAPWLADERWYVARNAAHILGLIGGPATAGLLGTAARHPEKRVRREAIAALARLDTPESRAQLFAALEGADAATEGTLLHALANRREPALAARLLAQVTAAGFAERPAEEVRAVLSALGATAGDEAIPDLEALLHRRGWFAGGRGVDPRALAHALARLGTPAAAAALERGARSRSGPVRDACREAQRGGAHE